MSLDSKSKNLFNYFKTLAEETSLEVDDKKILKYQYDKIKDFDSYTALNLYLNPEEKYKLEDDSIYIFPFGSNLSQINAIRNVFNSKMSVIEGPPGTGKTQTILNIITNLIIRDKNCQIVSNNNSAIENIDEKLKEYKLDFFVAKLGSNSNKEDFIVNQKELIDLSDYKEINLYELKKSINEVYPIVVNLYKYEIELSKLEKQLNEVQTEYKHFKITINNKKNLFYLNGKKENLMKIYNEIINLDKISFFKKFKYIYFYKIGNFDFFKFNREVIIDSINNTIYQKNVEEIKEKINQINKFINGKKDYKTRLEKLSMLYLKKWLYSKYKDGRKKYSNIKSQYKDFIKDYPIILSTTYSSKNTFNPDTKFDYVIMDEASQIDIVTGALALSTASNSVIIGDEKQLPNVITNEDKKKTDEIFNKFNINKCYSYSNSLLTSIKMAIPNLPIVLLKEHYRCHPKIIDFCNKEFYNNELIIMTNDNDEKDVIKIIRSSIGNHSRDKMNQREIDILKELLNQIDTNDVGVITPYRNQVKEIQKKLPDIEVNTVHKYQGREKDTIIISTVDDKISDFVNDSHILNVAISRAKKHLYLIMTGNNIDNTYLKDLVDYTKYNNFDVEKSKIYSIFDFLYKQYENDRRKILKTKISEYDSENLIYLLIQKELSNRKNLDVIYQYPLNMLIKDTTLLKNEEIKFIRNDLSHLDFLIYNKITKRPLLAVEVDGYTYHKEGTKQEKRDEIKDKIMKKYNIPILRFKTNGSNEQELLHKKLDELLNMAVNINE